MIPGPRAIESKLIGVGIQALVAVRRRDAVKHAIALLDRYAIDFDIGAASSGQQLDR